MNQATGYRNCLRESNKILLEILHDNIDKEAISKHLDEQIKVASDEKSV
jgi:hypothetical protein